MTAKTPANERERLPRLSLIIPAYNEELRIGGTLHAVEAYLARQAYASEVIVADDGSRDGTAAIVRESFPRVQLISYPDNRGKGCAVRRGMMAARGEYRVFYDADASTPIEELDNLWPQFAAGADVVIGSRSLPGSNVQIHQAWYREKMGRMFNRLLRVCRLTAFPDTQCGFKGFTDAACRMVFPRQTIERFSFDAELLYIAQKHGLRIVQVPVRWINSPHTSVSLFLDSLRMFLELVRIRINALRGKY